MVVLLHGMFITHIEFDQDKAHRPSLLIRASGSWDNLYSRSVGQSLCSVRLLTLVETTARNTCRPLLSLTITDLGSQEDRIEAELTRWFSIAHRWRAILLIDEADIFLERHHHTDISRNGIVSGQFGSPKRVTTL